jgi:hypothetical protein
MYHKTDCPMNHVGLMRLITVVTNKYGDQITKPHSIVYVMITKPEAYADTIRNDEPVHQVRRRLLWHLLWMQDETVGQSQRSLLEWRIRFGSN